MHQSKLQRSGTHDEGQQEGGVKQLSAGEFLSFASAPYAIIQVGNGVTPGGFPAAITLLLGVFQPVSIRLGVLDLGAIERTKSAQHLVRLALERLTVDGLPMKPDVLGRPPAGYYLFADGAPIAFHAGGIDWDKDGNQVGLAAFAFVASLMLNSKEVAGAVPHIATMKAGARVAEAFELAIRKHRESRR